ncbi:hypothetical protein [Rhodothermus bifroesti]|uniref:Uncharacterized protein n=1 Tax=Rhodothermus marinus TaxID=29549 RepID=A0A7V2F6I6_RHOMR|nr:hypothetical protein [Rhodothermus bifroesti]
MEWVYQAIGIFLALMPMVLGTLLWRFFWKNNNDSGSSQDPPSGGDPWRRPVPPSPRFQGDRGPRPRSLDPTPPHILARRQP